MARTDGKNAGPAAADLIEEAVHLLRRNLRELVWYYAGTGPFVVALLYFWAFVAWFAPLDGEIAAGALLLAVLFGWMKAGQRRFALGLLGRRLGGEPPRWTAGRWLAEMAAQFRLQTPGILLVPLAAAFGVPLGWVYCYYQSATAIPPPKDGDSRSVRELAWEQMQLWPVQNHLALSIFVVLWLMVFLNLAVAFYAVPALATQWLGIKTIFAFSGWSLLNSTFLALVAGLTHLSVDPLIKTFYLLRVFHGGARRTGADIRLILGREQTLRRRGAHGAMGAALLLLGVLWLGAPGMRAAEPAPVVQTVPAPVLDRALDRVLGESEFRWRLRPLPTPPGKGKEGMLKGFVRSTLAVAGQMIRTVGHWVNSVREWASDLLPGGKGGDSRGDAAKAGARHSFDWMATLQLGAYLLLMVVAGLLIFVTWKVWRHNRVPRPAAAAAPLPAGVPDLRDEKVEASRLPADGWLDLARRQVTAGEWRLALRALFLATLARHAQEGWLSLAKFKTNLDYETELRRRTRGRVAVVDQFRDRRCRYEEVWYGTVPASDALVRDWLRKMEGIE